jgi:hypothetical protein
MLKPIAFALALIAAGPAAALSCLRPDIGASFQTADDRPEAFVVALGALTRVGANVPDGPDTGDPNNRVGYSFAARFDGHFASSQGFDAPQGVDVTVEVECIIAWCGSDSLSDHALYFLRRDGTDRYALEAGPCQTFVFDNPVEHQLMEVIGLMP